MREIPSFPNPENDNAARPAAEAGTAPAAPEAAPDAATEALEDAREQVIEAVEGLHIGLDLEKHPRLADAMAATGAHFEDGVVLTLIVGKLYDRLREAVGLPDERPEALQRDTLLSDVGKAGPVNARPEYARAIRDLFVPPATRFDAYKDGQPRSIDDFLAHQPQLDAPAIRAALQAEGIVTAEAHMIEFWRKHAGWTLERLRSEIGHGITEEDAVTAASHHLLEEENPATLDLAHAEQDPAALATLKKAQVITVVDQYQALRDRGGKSHEEAVALLRDKVAKKARYPDALRKAFVAALDVIDAAKDEVEPLLAA